MLIPTTVLYPLIRLQKFKLNIANTVITQDNSSLKSMDTGQLLDLFTVEKEGKRKETTATTEAEQKADGKKSSLKTILESMGDLWDSTLYETEYNLDHFMQSLKWEQTIFDNVSQLRMRDVQDTSCWERFE